MFVSYDLRDNGGFSSCRGADHIRLGSRVHAAVDPGQGLISARRGQGLDLRFYGFSEQAAWLELAFKLGGSGKSQSDKAWRNSSRFYCRLRMALQTTAPDADPERAVQEHPAEARLALRLHQEEGFEDIFAPVPLPLQFDSTWVSAEIMPPVQALSRTRAVDMHLFLPPRDGALQVSDFAVTAAM